MPKEKYNLKEGLNDLRKLIPRWAQTDDSPPPPPHLSRMFYQAELGGLTLSREEAAEYERVLQKLTLDDETKLVHTRAEVDKLLSTAVLKALDILGKEPSTTLQERIDREVDALKTELTSAPVEWDVWRDIEGLIIPAEGFQFGNVFFCHRQHAEALAAKKSVETRINSYKPNIAKWHRDELKCFERTDSNWVLCRVKVKAAGGESARHLAKIELDAAIPILNFFASFMPLTDSFPYAFLRETSDGKVVTDIALTDGTRWNWQMTHLRIVAGLNVNDFQKKDVMWKSVQRISAMLIAPKNNFNERLLAGIKWAGKGASARNKEEAFLFYAIALEALILGPRNRQQLSYQLRLRVGQLLGPDKTRKIKWRDLTRHLYELRNAIAHSGKNDIASIDLQDLRFIVQSCIEIILCHVEFANISTEETLDKWFEDSLMNALDTPAKSASAEPT